MASKLISLEGNIGSGKTTLFRLLQSNLANCAFVSEPVDLWQKSNLLRLYYQQPARWAFTFQTYALYSRLKTFKSAFTHNKNTFLGQGPRLFVSERSVEADREIFGKLLYEQKMMNDTEYNIYLENFETFANVLNGPQMQHFVYLRCSPLTAHRRVLQRSRDQEKGKISLQYLTQIHDKHEAWLGHHANTTIIDADQDFQNNPDRLNDIVQAIKSLA